MANLTIDQRAVEGSTTRVDFVRTLAALFLFVAPVAYVAYLAAVVVHEVLGHGLAALAFGGRFHRFEIHADGLGYAVVDGYGGHEVAVLAAGVLVSMVLGVTLLIAATRIRRPFLGITVLLFAVMLLEPAVSYAAWGSLSATPPSDFGRIVQLSGGPNTPTHIALSVGFGVTWLTTAVLWMRPLVRRVESLLGSLSTARAVAVYVCFAALLAGFWLLFDWDQVAPGLGRTPAYVGIGFECGVLAVLIARRRSVVESTILPRAQWRRAVVAAWAVSVAVLAVVLVASHGDDGGVPISNAADRERHVFDEFVERCRAAGEPTTFRELCGSQPPDDVNSAPEIAAAIQWLDDTVGHDSTWTVVGPMDTRFSGEEGPWYERASPEQIRDLTEFLAHIRPFFDRVEAAADRPRCWLEIDVDERGDVQSERVLPLQRVTRVFLARALVDPDPAARVESCRTLCILSRRFEPVESTGHLVKTAITRGAVFALRRGVEAGAIDAAAARARLDPVLAQTWLDLHSRISVCELVQTIGQCQAMLDGRIPTSPGTALSPSAPAVFTGWCEHIRSASRWPTQPYADYLRRARAHSENARENGQLHTLIPFAAGTMGQSEARGRLARVALAVAEHRAKDGDFPASLDELKSMFADGVPLDPFIDAPFVYEKTATGVRIATIGRLPEDPPLDEAELRKLCLVWDLER